MLVKQFVRQLRSFNFDVSDFSCGGGGDRWAAWMMVMVELACATRSLSRIWGGLDYAWPASGTRDKLSLSVLFAALLHNILFLLPLPSYAYSLAYFVAFLCAFYQLR